MRIETSSKTSGRCCPSSPASRFVVCLIITTRPRSASPSYFCRQGYRKTAPDRGQHDRLMRACSQLHSNPQGYRVSRVVTRGWALSLLSRTAYLLRTPPSSLLPPTRRPFTPSLSSSRQSRPDRAACPSAVRIYRRRSPSAIVHAFRHFSRPQLSPYGLTLLDRFPRITSFHYHVPSCL